MAYFSWFWKLATWLTEPSVLPWVGAVAATIALVSVDLRTWRKSPFAGIRRAVWVAIVWLVAVWLLGAAVHCGFGNGKNGDNDGPGPNGPASGGNSSSTPPGPRGPVPDDTVLEIRFVPSVADPTKAKYFSCVLSWRGREGQQRETFSIHAQNMQEVDRQLVQRLQDKKADLPEAPGRRVVLIRGKPFPGKNVLRRVQTHVEKVLPTTTVVIDE